MCKAIALGAAFAVAMSVVGPSSAATYSIIGVGPPSPIESKGFSINQAGQVAGWSRTAGNVPRAFLYSNGVMQDLGALGGSTGSFAFGINDAGQVVGSSGDTAFLFSNGVMQDIGTLGGPVSQAFAINNVGQVVGWSYTDPRAFNTPTPNPHSSIHAFLYSNGVMQDLGTLGGSFSAAYGINDSGEVVGTSGTTGGADDRGRAFLYSGGVMLDLGTLEGLNTSAGFRINNTGQVVGWSSNVPSPGNGRAFLYGSGVMQNLGTLGSGTVSEAAGINNAGQVVGSSTTDGGFGQRAFLYSNGVIQDLNALLPSDSGWVLESALGINDAGQITGQGIFKGQFQAFLATPVPLPGALGLLIAGLAGFGLAGRARCRSGRA